MFSLFLEFFYFFFICNVPESLGERFSKGQACYIRGWPLRSEGGIGSGRGDG